MALSIPPGGFDSAVDLMAMSLAEVGASVGELLEVGGLDRIELGSRETAWRQRPLQWSGVPRLVGRRRPG